MMAQLVDLNLVVPVPFEIINAHCRNRTNQASTDPVRVVDECSLFSYYVHFCLLLFSPEKVLFVLGLYQLW